MLIVLLKYKELKYFNSISIGNLVVLCWKSQDARTDNFYYLVTYLEAI
jgi:hypothetical protein